jgi:CheY-like chemotaxis protein
MEFPTDILAAADVQAPPAASAAVSTGARRGRILIADDNRDAADSMGMLLELAGHEVDIAHSGGGALAIGRERNPDVVILDIGMPDLNGYEVARQIRQEAWGRSAHLLAVTGWGQAADKDQARAAGFDRHMTKPVDPDLLEGVVAACLDARHGTVSERPPDDAPAAAPRSVRQNPRPA